MENIPNFMIKALDTDLDLPCVSAFRYEIIQNWNLWTWNTSYPANSKCPYHQPKKCQKESLVAPTKHLGRLYESLKCQIKVNSVLF